MRISDWSSDVCSSDLSIMHATARDYARFGEFLRNRGVANGQRLLPESWMDFMLTPSPTDGGYGGHIWLNRSRPAGVGPALWPDRGPNDLLDRKSPRMNSSH